MSPTTRTLHQGGLRDWIAQGPAARLLAVLNADGGQARVVGGSVRNALLGEPLGDIDLATNLPPADVMGRAKAAGFHAVPTGIDHGTVTVIIEGAPFEVTTLRSDVETHGRRATVKFGSDWKEDALRRDFTINALSISADGKVHDYVGGLDDLAHRRVRFIGDAQTRIREDYLRILRFFRFHACYGEGLPDPTGLHACIVARDGMARLSRERVRMELLKLLRAEHAVPVLAVMAESGLLTPILGGVPHLASLSNLMKAEADLSIRPDSVRRLGALAVWIKEDADRLRERLRLTNDEYTRLVAMSEHWWRIGPSLGERRAKELLYRLGAEACRDRVLIAWSRSHEGLADPAWRALADLSNRWTPIVFPVKAADFLARGIEKGPKLGAALRNAEEAWIEAGFPEDDAALKRIVDENSTKA